LIAIAVGIVLIIGIILALREVWCWYFKLNRIVDRQERQIDLLMKQLDMLSLIALKRGVPDTKIYDAITRREEENLIAKDWIEKNHNA